MEQIKKNKGQKSLNYEKKSDINLIRVKLGRI